MPKSLHAVSGPPSTTNSAFSSRESSPVRASSRPHPSTTTSRIPSRSRQGSQERGSLQRSATAPTAPPGPVPATPAAPRALSQTPNKPPTLTPPTHDEPSPDPPSPDKFNMPLWGSPRKSESEPNMANTSSKRTAPEDPAGRPDRSGPRPVNRSPAAPGSALETVQEMASDQSTPSTETVLNQPLPREPDLHSIEEDATPTSAPKHPVESGSDSGGRDPEQSAEKRRRISSGSNRADTLLPKRSSTSLSAPSGARAKPTDGSVRNMIVETETVSSIPQVSLGVATGDRTSAGRGDPAGTLRMKPSTETIRPKREKRRTRKPAALSGGAPSSKADFFEAKVASAVDEADVSDSDETFVYESNPPDPYPVRQNRYHSRTPSATSMASQADQLAGRPGRALRDAGHSVTGKRSMKFTNNVYSTTTDGDPGEESARSSRMDGSGGHTARHHHFGRYGRNSLYPSLFDGDGAASPPCTNRTKSPRHLPGNGMRASRPLASRPNPGYRSLHAAKRAGDRWGYDFDAEGADDERTPLVGRSARGRHGTRRPNSASLRQMEYMQQRHRGYCSQSGLCVMVGLLLLLVASGAATFLIAVTKPLVDVQVLAIQNVLSSEQELMLDLSVQAVNLNLFPVTVDDMDVNLFAKSRFVGSDAFWRDPGSQGDPLPRPEHSRRRVERARTVRGDTSPDNGTAGDPTDPTLTVRANGGVDKGTDPIDSDPAGDPQTMLLGRVFRFDSPLAFEASPWNHLASTTKGQIRLPRPGNKTEEGGTERWERVLQHPFDLIVRGVIKYPLPLSSRYHSASISSSVRVIPDGKGGDGEGDEDPDHDPPTNNTVVLMSTHMSRRSTPPVPSALDSVRDVLGRTARVFLA